MSALSVEFCYWSSSVLPFSKEIIYLIRIKSFLFLCFDGFLKLEAWLLFSTYMHCIWMDKEAYSDCIVNKKTVLYVKYINTVTSKSSCYESKH